MAGGSARPQVTWTLGLSALSFCIWTLGSLDPRIVMYHNARFFFYEIFDRMFFRYLVSAVTALDNVSRIISKPECCRSRLAVGVFVSNLHMKKLGANCWWI